MTGSTRRRLIRFAFAAAVVGLISPEPGAAADFEIPDVRLDLGGVVIAAPRIAVKGSPLGREAFLSLFGGGAGESAAARMGRLSADEISAPELVIEQTYGPQKQVTSYRDVRFTAVREGVIGRGEAASGAITVTGAQTGPMSGAILRTGLEGLDLKHIARVVGERARPGVPETSKPLFARFEQDGYTLDLGAAGRLSVGKSSGRGMAAKVGPEPLGEILSRIVALSDKAERAGGGAAAQRTPEQSADDKRMGVALLSLFESVEIGSGQVADVAMNVTAPPEPGEPPVAVEMRIARMAYGEDAPAKSGFAMEGLEFAGGGARGVMQSLSYHGFALGSVIGEIKALLTGPEPDLDTLDWRKFIPKLGVVQMVGLSVDAPQKGRPGQPAPPPLRIGLGGLTLSVPEQLNGVPTSIALAIDNLVAPVTEGTGNPAARDMIAMGYRMVDVSAKLELAWNAAREEIAVQALSLAGAGMGRFEASGTLGNVTRDLFASDLALAQVAALGATVRNVQAKLVNQGLAEKLIENQARKARRQVEDVRREYAMIASLGLSAILGPSDAAKTLTAAISRFAAKPGSLTVEASARSASGLGLADVIALGSPIEIFDKIDIKANAE